MVVLSRVCALFALLLALPARAADAPGSGTLDLAVGQGLNGVLLGQELCYASPCHDGALVAFTLLAGPAAALAARGVTMGQAMTINAGSLLGVLHALIWADPGRAGSRATLIGQMAGTGLGIAVAVGVRPDADRVALANSAALWSGIVVYHLGTSRHNPDPYLAAMLAADLGWLAGYGLWPSWRVSRAQALGMDTAIAGGVLLASNLWPDDQQRTNHSELAPVVGVGVGAALAYWLIDAAPPACGLMLAPQPGGVAVVGRF